MAVVLYESDTAQRKFLDAVAITESRRSQQSALIQGMVQIANRYNAEYAIPVMGNDPDTPQPVLSPNLIAEAVDQPAVRASSVNPTVLCPWLHNSDLSRARANTRRKIISSTYSRSKFNLLRRRMYRQIAGFGMASIVCLPDENGCRDGQPLARISLRNALSTYADPQAPEDIDIPSNVGFVHQMSGSALRNQFPQSRQEYGGVIPLNMANDPVTELWDVLEWIENDYVLIGIQGKSYSQNPYREPIGASQLLKWYPNRCGVVPAVTPMIITLDKMIARLTQMIGKSDLLAYLWELDIAQMQRAVAPDRYAIARDDERPEIVSNDGHWMDGRTGEMNLLAGVGAVGELRGAPDPNNIARMNAVEQNARQESGLVGPLGGQTSGMSGQLRTGRGIDTLLSASVDPKIAEMQEIAATSLGILNEIIFSMYTSYWGERRFTVFSGWPGDRGMVEFIPKVDIETNVNTVYYPLPGTDAYTQTVQLGQMKQAGMISDDTARRLHPWIDDADAEKLMIEEERIETLTWSALAMRAQNGEVSPVIAAELIKRIRTGESIEEAILNVQEAEQKKQANVDQQPQTPEQAAAAAQPGNPALAGPQAQPGVPGGQGTPLSPAQLISALRAQPPAANPNQQAVGAGVSG